MRQLTVTAPSGTRIRPDLTVFLNGLPVAVIELKDPTDTEADLGVAIQQLSRYKETVARPVRGKSGAGGIGRAADQGVGSITSDRRPVYALASGGGWRSHAWRRVIRGLFEPRMLVDYLKTCVVFEEDERGAIAKKIAGYHQFRAVRKMRASVIDHLKFAVGRG